MNILKIILGVALASMALSASAIELGRVNPQGSPIIPSAEGRLIRLTSANSDAKLTAYRLVHDHGEKVIVMDQDGLALTPTRAWERFGGQKPAPTSRSKHSSTGTFSMPGTSH